MTKIGPDPAFLATCNAPLTVQVMRIRANQREPIPMTVRDGYNVSGPGWTHDELLALNQEILDVAGGGSYEVIIIDSSEPRKSHKWQVVFPVDIHGPSKMPTTYTGYAQPTPPPTYAQPQPTFAQPYGYPQPPRPPTPIGYGYGQPNPYAQPPFGYGAQQPPFNPFMMPPYGHGHAPQNSETEALKNELQTMRLQQIQTETQRKLEEMQAQHRRELETMRATPRHDERLEREREAREKAERDAIEARRQAEAALTEARHQAQLEAIKASIPKNDDSAAERRFEAQLAEERRRFDMMKTESDRRMDTLTAELTRLREAPRGPDPITLMLEMRRTEADMAKETARINAEASKETERLRAESAKATAEFAARSLSEVRGQIINPVDMARILHDASKSGDELTRTMLAQFTDIMNLQQQATQNIMGMQPQGEGVAAQVVKIADKIADRFSTGDTQVKVAQANAARAQADAAKAQMQTMQQGWQTPPPVVQPGQGLSGALPPGQAPVAPEAAPAAPVPTPTAPVAAPTASPLRDGGKTDHEWFGDAIGDVMNLRTGAALFLDAVSVDPPKMDKEGNVPGLQPDQAAFGLLVASQEITKQQVKVLAFDYLWGQQMYTTLVDVLLPDLVKQFGANGQMYKAEMLRFLDRLLNGLPLHTPEELAALAAAEAGEPAPAPDEAPSEPEPVATAPAANGNGHGVVPTPPPVPPRQPARSSGKRP